MGRGTVHVRQIAEGNAYHIMTKSIAGYQVFRSEKDYKRMLKMMKYYSYEDIPFKFSYYCKLRKQKRLKEKLETSGSKRLVDIIAYCIMPTHVHFVLFPLKDGGVSKFMQNLLNSYTRYFNNKNKRRGPLWQGKFKSVLVENDEQLLHSTRYIHLNPVTSEMVKNPIDWNYSSDAEYLGHSGDKLCNFRHYIDVDSTIYKRFVESRVDYQKELAVIKHIILE